MQHEASDPVAVTPCDRFEDARPPTPDLQRPVRIGAVSYLNTKPLIYGLQQAVGDQAKLSLALPSRLADDLSAGDLDIGLIPVVEYFQHPAFQILSNAAIACRGPVWSVRIFFRCQPRDVQVLALDEGSRTSVALSKVLFHSRFGFVPETVPLAITDDPMDAESDAVLVIGDRAMHPEKFRPKFKSDWDLGESWLEETGLPFVFAMWVARSREYATIKLREALENARDSGLSCVQSIAAEAAARYQLSTEQCVDYLTNYIRFYLRDDELAGLNEFRRRCDSLGLISKL